MKDTDLTPEELASLPKDVQEGLKDGTVLALPVPKSSMSNRFFTIAAAIIIGAMLTTIWVPATTFGFIGASLGALGWMTLYWYESLKHARTRLHLAISEGVLDRTIQLVSQALESRENLDGTNNDETGLKEGDNGTGTVH